MEPIAYFICSTLLLFHTNRVGEWGRDNDFYHICYLILCLIVCTLMAAGLMYLGG